MTTLMIIQARVTDADRFKQYTAVVPALVARFGGRYRVLGGTPLALEGQWSTWPDVKTVISEWPDRATALAFWHSDAYRQAAQLRAGAGEFNVVLIDALPQPDTTTPTP